MLSKSERGFTLIELMTVVALIGIITTLALPRWASYYARAGRSEVYANLPSLRSLNETYFADKNIYTDNLYDLGFAPMGKPRYLYGFTSDITSSGTNDTAERSANGYTTALMINAVGAPLTSADLPSAPVSATTYRAGAAANLDNDGALDLWTLDKASGMVNVLNDVN